MHFEVMQNILMSCCALNCGTRIILCCKIYIAKDYAKRVRIKNKCKEGVCIHNAVFREKQYCAICFAVMVK